jgi:hypothetical protein
MKTLFLVFALIVGATKDCGQDYTEISPLLRQPDSSTSISREPHVTPKKLPYLPAEIRREIYGYLPWKDVKLKKELSHFHDEFVIEHYPNEHRQMANKAIYEFLHPSETNERNHWTKRTKKLRKLVTGIIKKYGTLVTELKITERKGKDIWLDHNKWGNLDLMRHWTSLKALLPFIPNVETICIFLDGIKGIRRARVAELIDFSIHTNVHSLSVTGPYDPDDDRDMSVDEDTEDSDASLPVPVLKLPPQIQSLVINSLSEEYVQWRRPLMQSYAIRHLKLLDIKIDQDGLDLTRFLYLKTLTIVEAHTRKVESVRPLIMLPDSLESITFEGRSTLIFSDALKSTLRILKFNSNNLGQPLDLTGFQLHTLEFTFCWYKRSERICHLPIHLPASLRSLSFESVPWECIPDVAAWDEQELGDGKLSNLKSLNIINRATPSPADMARYRFQYRRQLTTLTFQYHKELDYGPLFATLPDGFRSLAIHERSDSQYLDIKKMDQLSLESVRIKHPLFLQPYFPLLEKIEILKERFPDLEVRSDDYWICRLLELEKTSLDDH